jgi:hypothetical protein
VVYAADMLLVLLCIIRAFSVVGISFEAETCSVRRERKINIVAY